MRALVKLGQDEHGLKAAWYPVRAVHINDETGTVEFEVQLTNALRYSRVDPDWVVKLEMDPTEYLKYRVT